MKLILFFIFVISIYAFEDVVVSPLFQQNPGQCRTTKFGGEGDICEPARNSTLQCKQFLVILKN